MKRTINGTDVSVEPNHLGRYLDEQAFQLNERDDNDASHFKNVLSSVLVRRLTPERRSLCATHEQVDYENKTYEVDNAVRKAARRRQP